MHETRQQPAATAAATFDIGGDLTVNRLGFGTMGLTGHGIWGEPTDPDECRRVLRRAVELDVNLIDTADCYGPHVSERLIAEALYPYRDDLVIATKGGQTRSGPNRWHPDGRPEHLREACEGSLARLRLDRIGLYQLDRVDPEVPMEESLGALVELRDEGKIAHIGLSNVSVDQLRRARRVAPIVSVQNRYNLTYRASEDVLEECEREGLAFIPWYPLSTGKLARPGGPLATIAERDGATPAQVALAWLLDRSPVMLPIPGTSSVAHLEETWRKESPGRAMRFVRGRGRGRRSRHARPAPLGDLHARMVDAVRAGAGLADVADLAAGAAGGSVAIVAPVDGVAIVAPAATDARLEEVRRYVADRLVDRPTRVPRAMAAAAPIGVGSEALGAVVLLADDDDSVAPLSGEVVRLAALMALTVLTLERAGARGPTGGAELVRALRERPGAEAAVVLARAGPVGRALAHGAIALCAQEPDRAGWIVPTITEQFPTAATLQEDGVVWALLPAGPGDHAPRSTTAAARRLARRLGARTVAGLSPFGEGPERLHRALLQARIVLELVRDGYVDVDGATGTWRLLLGAAVTDLDELVRCVATSIGPALEHDARMRTELVATFRAYLEHGGNMNATAAAIYAHRHTVAARLDRVRALTGLDPVRHEDREQLGVGLKAHAVVTAALTSELAEPTLAFPTELVEKG